MEQSETWKRLSPKYRDKLPGFYTDKTKKQQYLFHIRKRLEHTDSKCSCPGRGTGLDFTCTYSVLIDCNWLTKEEIEEKFT